MQDARKQLFAGFRVTALWTLASRVLGMVRDVATAALLGMSAGGVMDAFVVAFRVPNLFRRLFGEGALAASYLPVLTEQLESDRSAAWKLVSVGLTWLAVMLIAIVLAAEAALWGAKFLLGGDAEFDLLIGLTATLLPYSILICLAAQVAATLHALGQFSLPAFVPVVLNVAWLVGAVLVAPAVSDAKPAQAYALSVCLLCGGVLQLAVQIPALRRRGFRFDYDWAASRAALKRITDAMLPMMAGLAITQINTLLDSLIAWFFSAPAAGESFRWLGREIAYPMQQGAAAAIYYGERLYQFPLGVVGIAVATVIYPLLSRHAARDKVDDVGRDLTLGLRLVLFLAVPAAAGLVLLAEPLARLLFQRGEFTAEDTGRTARMIACYGAGAWAYCSLPVLVRGFYALGNRTTPVRVGAAVVLFNLALNLTLIWFLAEAGLAVATSVSAALQVLLLAGIFSGQCSRLGWSDLLKTLGRSVAAASFMSVVGLGLLQILPASVALGSQLIRVGASVMTCVAVYLAVFVVLGGDELRMLSGRRGPHDVGHGQPPANHL